MHDAHTAGRTHPEPGHRYRGPFQRDRDRITHSSAFRRLAFKTQVFTGERGDYHRTRLTHTLEVASIARTMARALRINEDLVEAMALMHDLGHPPFGHAGEDVLDECLAAAGGFSHNQQGLRIVELLEKRYPEFPGLNLSRELLDGQQHRAHKHEPHQPSPLLEAQVVDLADGIAYTAHDADDALNMGLLQLEELEESTLWSTATQRVRQRYGWLDREQLARAVVHQVLDTLVSSAIETTREQVQRYAPGSPADVQQLPPLASLPQPLAGELRELSGLLFRRVYRHPNVLAKRATAGEALREIVAVLVPRADELPAPYDTIRMTEGPLRAVGDFVAALTDRAALDFQRQIRGVRPPRPALHE